MRPKGIFATTVRLIAQNFADYGTINAQKFYRYFLSNFANFDEFRGRLMRQLLHSVVGDPTATIVEKKKKKKEMFLRLCGLPPL